MEMNTLLTAFTDKIHESSSIYFHLLESNVTTLFSSSRKPRSFVFKKKMIQTPLLCYHIISKSKSQLMKIRSEL